MHIEDSILLFKSTFRPEYRKLLLTGLGSPINSYFWTYYQKKYPSSDLVRVAKNSPSSFEGKKGTLILFDHNPDAKLKFYPLRDFTVWKIDVDGAIIFHLCPAEYYDYTLIELKEFNEKISEEMSSLPPRENSWAQFFSLRCLNNLHKSANPENWEKLVQYLDPEEVPEKGFKESVFIHINYLKEIEKGSNVQYNKESGYNLGSGKRYELTGSFYKPSETKESFTIRLDADEDIIPVKKEIKVLPGRNMPFKFEFQCKRITRDKYFRIRIDVPEKSLAGTAPQFELPVRIGRLSLVKRIGWAGLAVFIGFIITSVALTYSPTPEIKIGLSAIGNLLSASGIVMWKTKD